MNQIKISIITPCYNGAAFIRTAIESFLLQNNSQIEMIVVNDGSTDETEKICNEYVSLDNFKLINVENGGAGKARNIGIHAARGDIIAFLDSDDVILHGSFNKDRVRYLCDIFKSGIDIICTPRLRTDFFLLRQIEKKEAEQLSDISNHMPALEFWTCLYKKNYLLNKEVFFYEYRMQDVESAFRYKAFSKTNNIYIDNSFLFYLQRVNDSSNTHTWNLTNVYFVKVMVYYDLYCKTQIEEDKTFLLSIALSNLKSFYKSAKNNNIPDDYNKIIYDYDQLICHECKKMRMSTVKLAILRQLFPFLKLIPKKKTNNNINNQMLNKIEYTEVLEKLKTISTGLLDKDVN